MSDDPDEEADGANAAGPERGRRERSRSPLERVRAGGRLASDRLSATLGRTSGGTGGGRDLLLILGVVATLYLAFVLLGLVGGRDATGLASALQGLTFLAAAYALLALALNLQWGYAGLFNIGVAGFMAVGVYTMGILANPPAGVTGSVPGLGLPLPLAIVGGMIASALVGLIAALPALRLDADYLAIVTIGISEIIRLTVNSTTFQRFTLFGTDLGTGGARGLSMPTNPVNAIYYTDPGSPASPPTAFGEAVFAFFEGVGIDRSAVIVDWTYALVLVAFVGVFYWLLVRVGNSPYGRVLKAIREDELVASSLGKDTRRFKITAFMLGCALMGLGGILWQGSQGLVSPAFFLPVLTFYVFIALIIGGAGSNTGSVVGGALFAGVLFQGPILLNSVVDSLLNLGGAPPTFVGVLDELAALQVEPLLAYASNNISDLRFILVGVVLVYLVQNRPEGLLGHRKEPAASVPLDRGEGREGHGGGRPATDGGREASGGAVGDDRGGDRE